MGHKTNCVATRMRKEKHWKTVPSKYQNTFCAVRINTFVTFFSFMYCHIVSKTVILNCFEIFTMQFSVILIDLTLLNYRE